MKKVPTDSTKIPNSPKKLRVIRTKDNKSITVYGYSNASNLTEVPEGRIKYLLNTNKETNGYKFYDE